MSVSRFKVNEYLGITLDYIFRGQLSITMLSYIEDVLTAFDKSYTKVKGTKSSTAPKNIFVVNEDYKKLDQGKVVDFHNLVAKALYDTNKARPDKCTAISFMTTRVRVSDKENWANLVHLMQYLRVTSKISLALSANGLQSILICENIQKDYYLWDVDYQSLAPKNRRSTRKFPQRQKLVALRASCQPSAGPNISLRHKGTMSGIISCIRTTTFTLFWRGMGRP